MASYPPDPAALTSFPEATLTHHVGLSAFPLSTGPCALVQLDGGQLALTIDRTTVVLGKENRVRKTDPNKVSCSSPYLRLGFGLERRRESVNSGRTERRPLRRRLTQSLLSLLADPRILLLQLLAHSFGPGRLVFNLERLADVQRAGRRVAQAHFARVQEHGGGQPTPPLHLSFSSRSTCKRADIVALAFDADHSMTERRC